VRSDAVYCLRIKNAAPDGLLAQDALSLQVCFEYLLKNRVAEPSNLSILGFLGNRHIVRAEWELYRLLREAAGDDARYVGTMTQPILKRRVPRALEASFFSGLLCVLTLVARWRLVRVRRRTKLPSPVRRKIVVEVDDAWMINRALFLVVPVAKMGVFPVDT
jgi:hypothetical protein